MTDQQNQRPSLMGAILTLNPKITLAFFMVMVAAGLLIWMGNVVIGKGVEAGTAALIAGLVTLFVKMADQAVSYNYQSSSGSDKKDDTNAKVASQLADKVAPAAPPPPAPVPPAVVVAWWSALTTDEQAALEAAGVTDQKVKSFVDAAKVGRATTDDLAYLVSKIPPLLTQERATALASL